MSLLVHIHHILSYLDYLGHRYWRYCYQKMADLYLSRMRTVPVIGLVENTALGPRPNSFLYRRCKTDTISFKVFSRQNKPSNKIIQNHKQKRWVTCFLSTRGVCSRRLYFQSYMVGTSLSPRRPLSAFVWLAWGDSQIPPLPR